jgi:hypothetical protein
VHAGPNHSVATGPTERHSMAIGGLPESKSNFKHLQNGMHNGKAASGARRIQVGMNGSVYALHDDE